MKTRGGRELLFPFVTVGTGYPTDQQAFQLHLNERIVFVDPMSLNCTAVVRVTLPAHHLSTLIMFFNEFKSFKLMSVC